jgi:hypothetical protein
MVHSPTPNCGGFGALRRHIFLALCCFLIREDYEDYEDYNELFEVGVAWLTASAQTPASS